MDWLQIRSWATPDDRIDQGKRRLAPPSGGIAGLYARTDLERGVWKAPSGNRARLVDVQALNYLLIDDESDRHVNLHIGFAALKPDEFVMIKIQQLAGAAAGNP